MCGCNNGCTGCGGNCGQPVKIVSKEGIQGPAGTNGTNGTDGEHALKYNDLTGIGVVVDTYQKMGNAYPSSQFSSFVIPINSLVAAGSYAQYVIELTGKGDNSEERYIQIRLNEDWPYTAGVSPDTLPEIVMESGIERVRVINEITRVTNTTVWSTILVEKYDTNNALIAKEEYQFTSVDLATLLPTHGAIDLDTDILEISAWGRVENPFVSNDKGVASMKTRVLIYNIP